MDSVADLPRFEDRPTPLDREGRQQRVRAVLMTYCQPKHHGQTAWEIAGFVLRALDEPEDEAIGVALAARLE